MQRIYKATFDNDVNDHAYFQAKGFPEAVKKAENERRKRQREARFKINGGDGDEIVEVDKVEYVHSFK
jgi:hypothetical protein